MSILIGSLVAAAGLSWSMAMTWLRHTPKNLTRGTQHLMLLGLLGWVIFVAGASMIVTGLARSWGKG